MNVAIIGGNGQLGSDLCSAFAASHHVIPLLHTDIDITDIDKSRSLLSNLKPDVIINTAAYHNVPLCEQNPSLAFDVNGIGALNLAKISDELASKLVHFSTDYVFDGQKKHPYSEEDATNPLNVYAVTKLAGENFILNYCRQPFVIRVSGIYGKVPCRAKGGNFITTMLRLAKEKPEVRVVNDEFLTPTPTEAISSNTLDLIFNAEPGLYHMTAEGQCSWFEFAQSIWQYMGLKTPLYPSSVTEFPVTVKRPFYSVLENMKLKKAGLNNMPEWKPALLKFLKQLS